MHLNRCQGCGQISGHSSRCKFTPKRAPASPAPAKESATLSADEEREILTYAHQASAETLRDAPSADPEQPSAAVREFSVNAIDAVVERPSDFDAAWKHARENAGGYGFNDRQRYAWNAAWDLAEQALASLRSVEPAPRGEQDWTDVDVVAFALWWQFGSERAMRADCGERALREWRAAHAEVRIAREGKAT